MWRNTTHSNWKSNVLYPLQNSFSSKPDQAHEEHPGPQVHCWCLSSHIEPKNPILLQISHFSMLCHIAASPSQFPISAPYALIQPTDTLQQLNQSVPRTLKPRPVRGDALLGLVPGHGYCHWTWAAGWHFGLTLVLSHSQTLAWGSGLLADCASCTFFNHVVGCCGTGQWWEWPLLCWPYFHVPEGTVDLYCSWTGGRVCLQKVEASLAPPW